MFLISIKPHLAVKFSEGWYTLFENLGIIHLSTLVTEKNKTD